MDLSQIPTVNKKWEIVHERRTLRRRLGHERASFKQLEEKQIWLPGARASESQSQGA